MTMLNGGTEVRGVGCQVGSAYSSSRLRACAFASTSSSFLNALWMLRAASSLLVQHSLFILFSATLSQAPLFVTYNCLFPPSLFVPHSLLFIFPPLVPASHNPMVYHHFSLFSLQSPLVVPRRLSAFVYHPRVKPSIIMAYLFHLRSFIGSSAIHWSVRRVAG